MKHSDDQSLFAWQLGYESMKDDICGPLAPHPSNFEDPATCYQFLVPISRVHTQ